MFKECSDEEVYFRGQTTSRVLLFPTPSRTLEPPRIHLTKYIIHLKSKASLLRHNLINRFQTIIGEIGVFWENAKKKTSYYSSTPRHAHLCTLLCYTRHFSSEGILVSLPTICLIVRNQTTALLSFSQHPILFCSPLLPNRQRSSTLSLLLPPVCTFASEYR